MEATNDAVTIDIKPFIWPITTTLNVIIICVTIIIAANILVGGGFALGGTRGTVRGENTVADVEPSVDTTNNTVTVGIDDDAIKGNLETATVAIVEFSDYECPFCQSFWSQTLGQIQEQYVNSGEVIFVYRDLPLSFHDPAATFAANLMECARDQGGDDGYYAMHDLWFSNSATNGAGIDDATLKSLANGAGFDADAMIACADAGTYDDEIAGDMADAAAVGINGTPGFVVGTLNADGSVTGEVISGAYPFADFEAAIQRYL